MSGLSKLAAIRQHKGLRQTGALFVKNVLVAWRNRWATGLRLLAPLLFLAMALMVTEVMNMNARRTGRIRDVSTAYPEAISSIPACSTELFIFNKPCLDFIFTPKNDSRVQAIVAAIRQHNNPPIPADRVLGLANRKEADDFIQARQKYVLGAVHFVESPTKQLQYIIQSNTSTPMFKGSVQSPNDFFQMPFMSAIAREISRHYLEAAGRTAEAATLEWQPKLSMFPHPQLSPGSAGFILPPFIFVACMFATIGFLGVVVSEKESGLRQALQTMGLQQGSYWLSWWLFEAMMAGITAWCLVGFGAALQLPMFLTNNVWLQFFLFWLFGMAMTSFACCTSVFLSNSQSAGNAGLAMILVGWICQALATIGMPYSPTIFYTSNGMGKIFFWIFALFPWNPLTKGVLDMSAAAENPSKTGLSFSERNSYCKYIPDPSRPAGGADMSWLYLDNNCVFSIEQCYVVLIVQAVAWMLAAVYFDNVQPDRHGVRLPFWYPFMPSYWANMLRSRKAAASSSRQHHSTSAGGTSRGTSQGGSKQHTPFAAPDAARKVARAISGVKEEGHLVIRCTSSAGGAAGADAAAARGLAGAATQGSVASTARHGLSSGMLRRRDNRNSSAGTQETSTPGSRDSFAGELVTFPSSRQAAGRAAQLAGQQQQQHASHSTQLTINPSVTVMQLSECSSGATNPGTLHGVVGGGGISSVAAPGTTVTLQQFQQMQAEQQQRAAAHKRWWQFWRVGEDSLTTASKQHGSMVAAAAGPHAPVMQSKEASDTFGLTPVVLDAGVLQEEQRMKAALFGEAKHAWTSKQDLIQVFGLRKVYKLTGGRRWWQFWKRAPQKPAKKQYVAVVDSWFGVPKGQLLCLLGPNGAGKTTTINCLIGALPPSGGDIRVMGHSLLSPDGLEVAQGVMGVCPQFDVLWDELTGREHMNIYGCIKGLPSTEVADKGDSLLEQVQLTAAANKRSGSYSGGMKRRLSVALALLGSPQLVFLDEPSTGMDPISRRAVWDAINAAKQQAAVVLTTHSMEEADALGDRIAIMVRGRMRVLGGSLTLKQKYGNGYQLRLRLLDSQPKQSLLVDQQQPSDQHKQQQSDAQHWMAGQQLTHRSSGIPGGALNGSAAASSSCKPWLPESPKLNRSQGGTSEGGLGPAVAASLVSFAGPATEQGCAQLAGLEGSMSVLQRVVAEKLGLLPTEEGKQMLHYVIPQTLGPELQSLLELLDAPERQRQLGLAEVHVSLATLEEVFLAVVKQAEQDYAAMHGQTVVVELPATGQQLELPVGQEVAVDATTGLVYAVDWAQDEWGRLAVAGVRQMDAAETSRYWQHRNNLAQ